MAQALALQGYRLNDAQQGGVAAVLMQDELPFALEPARAPATFA